MIFHIWSAGKQCLADTLLILSHVLPSLFSHEKFWYCFALSDTLIYLVWCSGLHICVQEMVGGGALTIWSGAPAQLCDVVYPEISVSTGS